MTQDEAPLPAELCKTIFYIGGPNEIHCEVLRKKKCISVCIRIERTEGGGGRVTEMDTEIKRDKQICTRLAIQKSLE